MGNTDEEEEFGEPDYARFRGRLEESLAALGQLLEQPGLGTGPVTMGTEAELFLVDGSARPRGDPGGQQAQRSRTLVTGCLPGQAKAEGPVHPGLCAPDTATATANPGTIRSDGGR